MQGKQASFRPGLLVLQIAVVLLLVIPFVAPAFRDNDQATILDSSLQVARGQTSFLHATFYNFDKQWGMFLILSWLFRILPGADPVLAGNALTAAFTSLAWILLGIRMGRSRRARVALLLPVLLSPALILYMPFLGTGWFSLALLLVAFFFLGRIDSHPSQTIGIALVAAAAACRGDVVLAVPSLALAMTSRARLVELLRRPILWLLAAAAVLPVLLGKLLAGARIGDTNPLSFDARSYFGFLLFGLTPAAAILLLLAIAVYLAVGARRPRFRFFYVALALSPLIPFTFYSLQLYTLRYLFLTLASILFVVTSRRSKVVFESVLRARGLAPALVVLAVLPWLVGMRLPGLNHPRLTIGSPTRFPTGDGVFPMAAYLGFAWQTRFVDHLAIDHNQRIWLADRSVAYQACGDGTVPFLYTPMSNFIEFAIRLQKKTPRAIYYLGQSACGFAYVDARSILRGIRPEPRDGPFFANSMSFTSHLNEGELILRVDTHAPATAETKLLEQLAQAFQHRYARIFLGSPSAVHSEPGTFLATFAEQGCCLRIRSSGRFYREPACPAGAPLNGWARTVYPAYMGM